MIIIIIILITPVILIQSCSTTRYSTGDVLMKKIEKSKQYQNEKFVNYNPGGLDMSFSNMLSTGWKFMVGGKERTPDFQLPVRQVDFTQITNARIDELKVTWVGHSSQIINLDGIILLTDPVYENSTTMMGPSRFNGDIPLNIEELPEIDLVLISHNHYDHLNAATIKQIHPKVKQFVVPLMVGAELENMGVPREKIIELDWWDEITLFDNFLVALTPTQHFSGRSMFDRNESLWGSFVLQGPHHTIYFSGDSGYFQGFKEIGDTYGPFDLTLMECGAYNKRWQYVHMMPEESAQAHLDLKGKIMQPMHWGTFSLALHSWYDPMVRVTKAADSLGIKLLTPMVGETVVVNENLRTERWWEAVLHEDELIPQNDEPGYSRIDTEKIKRNETI